MAGEVWRVGGGAWKWEFMCQETLTLGFCLCVIGHSFSCLRMAQMKVAEKSACGPIGCPICFTFGSFDESASANSDLHDWVGSGSGLLRGTKPT